MKTRGILIFGANGSGKTTLARALAQALGFFFMDIETYHFAESAIPYTAERPPEERLARMLADIGRHGDFVLSAVTGDFGGGIQDMYALAVYLSAPLGLRLARVRERALAQHGARVLPGGDMHAQQDSFNDFVAARPLQRIEHYAEALTCPVIYLAGERAVDVNVAAVVTRFDALETRLK